ncbi:MAG: peptidylprolyl isomerase [Ruminococcaceae bacterium]|nr:peptidylprolyl isomerase [Oscillospiraceae bacterium]
MKIGRIILSAILAASCIFGAVGCDSTVKSSVGNTEIINFVDGDKIAEINIEGYGTIKAKLFPDLAPKGVENFIKLAEQKYYNGLKIHRVLGDQFIQGGSLNGDGTGGKALIDESGTFGLETSEQARHFYGALCYANVSGKNSTQFFVVTNNEPQDLSTFDTEQMKAAAAANADLKSHVDSNSSDYSMYEYKEQYYTALAGMVTNATEFVTQKYKDVGGIPMFDGGYTVFGQVYEGYDVLEAIAKCDVENNAYSEKSKPIEDIVITSVNIVTYKTPGTGEATAEAEEDEESKSESAEASDAIVDDTAEAEDASSAEDTSSVA